MSKKIASAAIRGAKDVYQEAREELDQALEEYDSETKVEFPNTAYFLPVYYAMTGTEIDTVGGLNTVLEDVEQLLPEEPSDELWTPYLGHTLDAGMATLFADEVIEGLKYVEEPVPYHMEENCPPEGDDFWLGAANDNMFRKRGLEFVDGSAPGFAAIVGAAPDNETAVDIAKELQEKNLYVFMSGSNPEGVSFAEQLREEGVQMGWDTRLVPFGKDITATVFALGFASRVAMAFGGVEPGDYRRNLTYNKNRTYAFVLALDEVDDRKYAQAAGAINFGFPTVADTDIPEILPTGICTYEHVVAMPKQTDEEDIYDEIVQKAIEVRGLKVEIEEVPVPVSYGPAFEGQIIRKEDVHVEFGGQRTPSFEYLRMFDDSDAVEDGKVTLEGPDVDDVEPGTQLPLGIVVDVYGRDMQEDFEPVMERMIHTYCNQASGLWHNGQRDINWIRISQEAVAEGFTIEHLGDVLHARLHQEYGAVADKIQVKLYTEEEKVEEKRELAREAYQERDDRIREMTDEEVDTFYSCVLCQSFAPDHVCIITPERSGLCGGYTWLDAKANYEIIPSGPNQPVKKGECLDEEYGKWRGVNEYLEEASRGNLTEFSAYSMMDSPMTSCGCFECIATLVPTANGVMIVPREFDGMTPAGMTFSTMAGQVGGGVQTPGFIGISKLYITSDKFISADGGHPRIVWMPKTLKEDVGELLDEKVEEKHGIENFTEMIADEEIATTEEEVVEFLQEAGHPALELEPMM